MHCASLGEFEQGRPVIEQLKKAYPRHKLLLTFFSPSGYEIRKDYDQADWVFYMPLDGPATARRFIEAVQPVLVIFVKYEFWYYYLKKLSYRNIHLLLISAHFRREMSFFKWYAGLQRKILSRFDHLFVQHEESKQLLASIGIRSNVTVSGDTRFDRVIEIAAVFEPVPGIDHLVRDAAPVMVAGSTWKEDEEMLAKVWPVLEKRGFRLIIAPHEIDEAHLAAIEKLFPGAVRYSVLENQPAAVLIVDNVGMLAKLYRYAAITYVGGGLSATGVHNVLEAAVYGKPVLFGRNYEKYSEAVGLVEAGGGFPFGLLQELEVLIEKLTTGEHDYAMASAVAKEFVEKQAGGTGKILRYIQENRLLTS